MQLGSFRGINESVTIFKPFDKDAHTTDIMKGYNIFSASFLLTCSHLCDAEF